VVARQDGPIARAASDCRLILQAIAGADPDDPSASTEPVRLGRGRLDFSRLRAALIPTDFAKTKGAEPEVKDAFDGAVRDLQAMGLRIEAAALPEFPASEVATTVLYAEALSTFENYYRDARSDAPTSVALPDDVAGPLTDPTT
jgi:aspartyl-tRNA(Asn)/glutamyl-tRNA(Gln) amidotransferase subunit A